MAAVELTDRHDAQKIRVVIAKPGLDGHDRGAKVIARALRDAGMEVIYTGLRQTPEQIVSAALQEDADAIGLSILSGAHMHICPRVMELLRDKGLNDVLVVVGGIIPDVDIPKLNAIGVKGIFLPGTPMQEIVDFIFAEHAFTRRHLMESMTKKLLLADDSITIQRVIELTFSGEDVQVLAASDGEEAISRIAAERPDIVLADIGMPKRSGYEVSAFVKGKPELSHIPVLLIAGAFEPVDDAKAKEVQCDGVLVKPFEPQQVIARVRELIGGAKGSPTQPAVSNIPRLATVLAAPRQVQLRKREKAGDSRRPDGVRSRGPACSNEGLGYAR